MTSRAIFMPSAETEKMFTVHLFNVISHAGFFDEALDVFAARADERADLFRIDLDDSMRGAYLLNSVRGAASVLAISARMCMRASGPFQRLGHQAVRNCP